MTVRFALIRALLIAALGFSLGTATVGSVAAREPAAKGERKVLGDLDLRTPDGRQISLLPLIAHKAIVMVFWATWCPLCREEVPRLNRLNADPQVKVLAVNEEESARKVTSFAAKYKVGYEVALDPDGSVARAFQVPGMPYCVILGRSGLIVYRGSGLPADIEYYLSQ